MTHWVSKYLRILSKKLHIHSLPTMALSKRREVNCRPRGLRKNQKWKASNLSVLLKQLSHCESFLLYKSIEFHVKRFKFSETIIVLLFIQDCFRIYRVYSGSIEPFGAVCLSRWELNTRVWTKIPLAFNFTSLGWSFYQKILTSDNLQLLSWILQGPWSRGQQWQRGGAGIWTHMKQTKHAMCFGLWATFVCRSELWDTDWAKGPS